ncbi:MAG: hypothetical protein AAF703_19770 [Cyanobacteria bacterium P01_D01_bin.105]
MVFATDFDPYNELERTGGHDAQRHSVVHPSTVHSSTVRPSTAEDATASNVVPLHLGEAATRVRIENKSLLLPRQPKLPFALQLLNRLQQGSAMVMGVLVTAALIVYGSTVYVDKSTSRALVQLDELQGESQQLTSANESIKQSLAEQAIREDSELEPYKADDVLLLAPAPRREGSAPAEIKPELPGPLGY